MLPKTPREAKRTGSKFYDNGRPCPKGHPSLRLASCGECWECNKADKRRANKRRRDRHHVIDPNWIPRLRNDPERQKKKAIRALVFYAIKCGILTPSPCKCGNPDTEAHHPDYSKPLEVEWVCRPCHHKIHAVIKS